jgi:xylulokinase
MHGTVLLDRSCTPLRPAIIWADGRSGAQVAALEDTVGRERLILTAGSAAAAGLQATTIQWLRRHEPDVWSSTHHILLPKDYIRFRMTGTIQTDPSDACGTLFSDIQRRTWSHHLLQKLGVDPARLPPIVSSSSVAGGLTRRAAADLGLPAGLPVIVGAADTAAGALGTGATSASHLLLTLSTGGQLVQPISDPVVDLQGRIHTFCTATTGMGELPGWYHLGAILSAGGALAWLRDGVFGLSRDNAAQAMSEWAGGVPAGARGLLFLPYLAGERTPHMNPSASGVLLGLRTDHGRAELVRAVMEGVALACRDAYDVLLEMGARPEAVLLAGGGAQSEPWRQIIADVLGLPVHPVTGSDHSATGAAMLAGVGLGSIDVQDAASTWPRVGSELLPQVHAQALYEELYALYREEYQAHRCAFVRLRSLARAGQ